MPNILKYGTTKFHDLVADMLETRLPITTDYVHLCKPSCSEQYFFTFSLFCCMSVDHVRNVLP